MARETIPVLTAGGLPAWTPESLRVKAAENALRTGTNETAVSRKPVEDSLRAKAIEDSLRVKQAEDALRVKEVEEQFAALRTSVICAFNQLLDLKDLNTGVHSTRLAEWGVRVGQELGLEERQLQNLEVAALLHDIGKVGIPDAILRKPGKLTDEEYALMKKHPEYGWAVLRMLPGFERPALDILHHHEMFDGKGYPAGLKENEIPIVSRIVCVIDAFDAMVSSRPYRQGLPPEEAIRRLVAASGTQFDPVVVQCFLSFAQAEMTGVFAAAGTSVSSAL